MGDDQDNGSTCSLSSSPTLFKLSAVNTSLSEALLEDELCKILSLRATLLEIDYNGNVGTILFCCYADDESKRTHKEVDTHVLTTIGKYTQETHPSDKKSHIFVEGEAASASIVEEEDEDDECVEYITEEDAYQLWLQQQRLDGQSDDDDQSNALNDLVSSPDGELVQPKHHTDRKAEESKSEATTMTTITTAVVAACTAKQLERDPGLFDFDNVERVHYKQVLEMLPNETNRNESKGRDVQESSWRHDFGRKPIVIYGLDRDGDNYLAKKLVDFQRALRQAIRQHGADTIVRTGNRETLVANGFHNSKAKTLSEVVDSAILEDQDTYEDNVVNNNKHSNRTIVFNPIHEMPSFFRTENVLGQWLHSNEKHVFPNTLWNALLANGNEKDDDTTSSPKFTLCMASEGFGIGMHKHGPALFFLTEGTKKWYLSHPDAIDEKIESANNQCDSFQSPTHPAFYRELSTHKCIQKPGELLLVPNLWYHEIYNLSSPTIGIQALADELPIPGTLVCMQR